MTYEQQREQDLLRHGVHFAEVIYRLGDDGEPVEDHRERINPERVIHDVKGCYIEIGGERYHFNTPIGGYLKLVSEGVK